MNIIKFIDNNYHNFNSKSLKQAAIKWKELLDCNGKMFISIAGAMSTARLGISLAELIRKNKIHAISTTGANLEEDLFNLLKGELYPKIDYKNISLKDDSKLENRVLDVCIPESVMREVENYIYPLWKKAEIKKESYFPHEYFFQIFENCKINKLPECKDSWLFAAKEKNIPVYIPGWEDSTIGNVFVSDIIRKRLKSYNIIKSGLQYMEHLVDWYSKTSFNHKIGFFQIGGGIAGDFPICCVPLINQDINDIKAKDFKKFPSKYKRVTVWEYFCQISDSTTSFGSYSGAECSEKITWGKLGKNNKNMFNINSDATIVFPLIANYVLGK